MKPTITPGPWEIVEHNNVWQKDGLCKICEVYPFRANAKAIAAVPEMIEALKLAVEMPESYDINYAEEIIQTVRHKAKEALEKAGQL